jgi:hypothetical protein
MSGRLRQFTVFGPRENQPSPGTPFWIVPTFGPQRGTFWVCDTVVAHVIQGPAGSGAAALNPIVPDTEPINAICMVPTNQTPETLIEGQGSASGQGIIFAKRNLVLPTRTRSQTVVDPLGVGPFIYNVITLDTERPVYVPEGYTLATALTPAPGTLIPGPAGFGSGITIGWMIGNVREYLSDKLHTARIF